VFWGEEHSLAIDALAFFSLLLSHVHSEKFTLSVFILSGPSLKATVNLEGPIAGPQVTSGLELFQKAQEFAKVIEDEKNHISSTHTVDFEHLQVEAKRAISGSKGKAGQAAYGAAKEDSSRWITHDVH